MPMFPYSDSRVMNERRFARLTRFKKIGDVRNLWEPSPIILFIKYKKKRKIHIYT